MDKTQASTGKGRSSTGRVSVPTPVSGGGGDDSGAARANVPTATSAGGGGGNGGGQSDGSGGGGGGASVTGSASVPTSLPSARGGGDTGGGDSDEATQSQQGAPSQSTDGGGSDNAASIGTCGTGAQSPTPGVAVSLILPGTLTASAKQDSSDSEDQEEYHQSPLPVKSLSPTTPHPKSKRKRHESDSDEVEEEEDETVEDENVYEDEDDDEEEEDEEGSDSSSVAKPPASSKKSKAASSKTPSKMTARPSSAKPNAIKTPRSQPAKKAKRAASTPSSGKPPASKTPRGKTPRSQPAPAQSSIGRSRAKHVPDPGDQNSRIATVSSRGRSKTIECRWPRAQTTVRKTVPVVRDEQLWVVHPDDYAGSKKKHSYIRDVYMVKCKDIVLGYLVEWVDGVEDWYRKQDLTVGPVDPNNPTNLQKWLAMIDRFMDDPNQHILHDFVRTDPFGSTFNLGDSADLDGLCGFRAVETALMWCGAPSGLVTQKDIDDYCAQAMKRTDKRIDMKKTGVTYQQLRGFLNQLSKESGSVDLKVLNKNLYCGQAHGLKGVVAAVDDGQTDAVYLVSGRAQFIKVGHVIALRKVGMKLICKDGLGESELLDQQWLGNLSYVRRFVWTTRAKPI
jgi:hypothetical protein